MEFSSGPKPAASLLINTGKLAVPDYQVQKIRRQKE
jgi:hypothetical protein